MWEEIPDEVTERFALRSVKSSRLKVPGGWIVRTIVSDKAMSPDGGAGVGVSQIFVDDADHSWKLEGSSSISTKAA